MKLTRTLRYNPALFSLLPFINVLFLVVVFFALIQGYQLNV